MALDHLLDALTREAEATAARLRDEARAEAATITDLSEEVAARRRRTEVDQVVRGRRERVEEEVAAARRAARDEVLRARERLLARVGAALRAACPEVITAPRYRDTLPHRLDGALACFAPEESVSARCSAALAEPMMAAWPRDRRVQVRADDALGSGYILASADGTIEVEDTLEARFEAHRGDLERQALHLLGIEG